MNLALLKNMWEKSRIRAEWSATPYTIQIFEKKYGVKLPQDFSEYFEIVNGMDGAADNNLFAFYSLDKIETVPDKFRDWHGIPKYSDVLNTLYKPESCFVFSDYFIHLEAFAIRLDETSNSNHHIYAICGGDYKVVAKSFSEFIDLYIQDFNALIIQLKSP